MKSAIVLCSGGLDSVVTAHYVKKKLDYDKLVILFFDYRQRALKAERRCAKKCAGDLNCEFVEIELKWLGEISNSLINKAGDVKEVKKEELKDTKEESERYYVPCRNLIFLSYSLALAESKEKCDIFVGFKNEGKEHYPDTTPEFVRKMNLLCGKGVKIIAPLIKKDKEDIILSGKKLGVGFGDTFSCYIGPEKHCGVCLACKLRKQGFYWAGVKDETEYLE